jgi:small subunit ribosomal protein S18
MGNTKRLSISSISIKKRNRYLGLLNKRPVDYKNIKLLKVFINDYGRIIPSKITKISSRKQRELSQAIKRARFLALLPFTNVHSSRGFMHYKKKRLNESRRVK